MKGVTLQEVSDGLYIAGAKAKGEKARSINDGLQRKPFPLAEGLIEDMEPERLLSLWLPRLEVRHDKIEGYQRDVNRQHVTRVKESLLKGVEVPPIIVSLYDQKAWLTDGQHRALGSIAARVPIPVIVQKRTMAQQVALFGNQAKQRRPASDLLVLRGNSPYDEYIQDALTDPKKAHPWSNLVAARAGDPRKLSPTTVRRMLYTYVGETLSHKLSPVGEERWDSGVADELGRLIRVFGNRQQNPHAFSSAGANALAITALHAIRRPGSLPEDIERWERWMPKFPFTSYAYVKNRNELADVMLAHWNKRLSSEKRIYRV